MQPPDGRPFASSDETPQVSEPPESVGVEVFDAEAFDADADVDVEDVEIVEAEVFDGDDIEIIPDPGPDPVVESDAAPERVAVDPRIEARRDAVALEQEERRKRVVMLVLALFVLAGGAWLIVRSPFLDVDHIVVTGIPSDRVAAVVAASGLQRRDPMLLVSTGAVTRRVEHVPGIASVHVTRDFPGTIHITARQQGVALWARVPKGVALIGHDGRVQRITNAPPPGVLELRGLARVPAPGTPLALKSVVSVVSQLPPAFARRVGALSAASPNDLRLYFVTGGEARLGDFTRLHDKGVAAEAVLERMNCAVAYVDVSSIVSPVVQPAPGATCNQ